MCETLEEKRFLISKIRSDHGDESGNEPFKAFSDKKGSWVFGHIFPQHNGVVESKNQALQEMTRTMIMPTTCQSTSGPKRSYARISSMHCTCKNQAPRKQKSSTSSMLYSISSTHYTYARKLIMNFRWKNTKDRIFQGL